MPKRPARSHKSSPRFGVYRENISKDLSVSRLQDASERNRAKASSTSRSRPLSVSLRGQVGVEAAELRSRSFYKHKL